MKKGIVKFMSTFMPQNYSWEHWVVNQWLFKHGLSDNEDFYTKEEKEAIIERAFADKNKEIEEAKEANRQLLKKILKG